MCEYDVTVHGRSFSIFLQAFSKSECAANESTVFFRLYISTGSVANLDNQYQDFLIPLVTFLNVSIIITQILNFQITIIT